MTSDPVIEIENLSLSLKGPHGQVDILRNIDLQVEAGQQISIVGPSGSGKTSLLLVMAGLETPTAGAIRIAGRSLAGLSEDALAAFRRDNIGIVFQNFHLIPAMTALENVAVPLELARRGQAFDKAREALRRVGLGHRLDHFPSQLSGGEQQRVALARAFVMEPKILFADEPTGNLDQQNGHQIVELMLDLRRQHNTTLILVTHDQGLAQKCDRLVLIEDGRVRVS